LLRKSFSRSTPPAPSRPSSAPPVFDWIDTPERFHAFLASLPGGPVALDTEFIRENSYYAQLEIIQIAGADGRIAVVDARKTGSRAPLAALLEDPAREKIFHSASQDIEILHQFTGAAPVEVFDTQLAAAMTGHGLQTAYVNLVREIIGRRLPNTQTVSDWSRRPLTADQLLYAAQDVQYLHTLREAFLERLASLNRVAWFREEQAAQARDFAAPDPTPDEERYRGVRDWGRLHGQELAVLRELAAWREREARERDLPRQQVMPDAALIALSRARPAAPQAAADLAGVPARKVYQYSEPLFAALRRALALAPEAWPSRSAPARPDIPPGLVELCLALLRSVAEEARVAPSLVATTDEIHALVAHRARPEAARLPLLRGWRRELIGERLLELLQGRVRLSVRDSRRLVAEER